jgi:hypothetical protein
VVQGQETRPSAVDTADARADSDVSEGANEYGADCCSFPIGKVGLKKNVHPKAGRQAESKRGYVSQCLKHVVVVPKATDAVRHTQLLNDRGAGWKTIENLTKDKRGCDNDESAYERSA